MSEDQNLPPLVPAPWATPAGEPTQAEETAPETAQDMQVTEPAQEGPAPTVETPTPAAKKVKAKAEVLAGALGEKPEESTETPELPIPTFSSEVKEAVGELVEMVTVTVPKAFKLRIDAHRELVFPAGVQEMEREHAEHWYAKANGVAIYQKG